MLRTTSEGQRQFDRFINQRVHLQNVSPRTAGWYRESFKWLGHENPSQRDLDDFVVRMRKKGLSPASCNNRIRAVRAYLNWRQLLATKRDPNRPLCLGYMKEEEKPPAVYSGEAISKILAYKPRPKKRRTHMLMLLMFDCGLRISECTGLYVEDIDFERRLIGVRGKGRKHRLVPMTDAMAYGLADFCAGRLGIVFGTKSGRRLSNRNALRDVVKLCRDLGIKPPGRNIHAIRHTMATDYIRQGGSVVKLQRILGHSRLQTTMRYVHLQAEDLVEEHQRIGILGNGNLRKTGPNLQPVDNSVDAPRKIPLTSVTHGTTVAPFHGHRAKA